MNFGRGTRTEHSFYVGEFEFFIQYSEFGHYTIDYVTKNDELVTGKYIDKYARDNEALIYSEVDEMLNIERINA